MDTVDEEKLQFLFKNQRTLDVFMFLKKNKTSSGVREIQRALNFSNPSSAYWHLNKLVEYNIVQHRIDNSYVLKDEYKNSFKLSLPVIVEHFVLKDRIIPNTVTNLIFTFLNMIIVLFLILIQSWILAAIIGIFSLIISFSMNIKQFKNYQYNGLS